MINLINFSSPPEIDRAEPRSEAGLDKKKRLITGFALATLFFILLNLLTLWLEPVFFELCSRQGAHTSEKITLYQSSKRTPDIIFLGSSRVPTGINPEVVEQLFAGNGLNIRALNLGIVASGIDLNYLVLKNIIKDNKKPQAIVYGLSEFDLLGLKPGDPKYDSVSRIPYASYLLRTNDFSRYSGDTLEKKVNFILNDILPLYRDQKIIHDAAKVQFNLDGLKVPRVSLPANGFIPKPSLPFTQAEIDANDVGYKYIIPNYNPDKPYLDDFNNFINLSKARGIDVFLVHMPVSAQFRSYWQDDSKISKYTELVRRLARQHDVPLLDLYQETEKHFPPESFWDTNHLSAIGANILADKLTREMLLDHFKSRLKPESLYRAILKDVQLPQLLKAGATASGQLSLKNISSSTWPVEGTRSVRLSYHWLDSKGQLVQKEGLRTSLSNNTAPGEEQTLAFKFTAPAQPGEYVLELDLVYEGLGWFGDNGNTTLKIAVKIQ